jgi:hypothetical protein
VGVFGLVSGAGAENDALRLFHVPNRDSATTRGQRSVAQNGQYSAPT